MPASGLAGCRRAGPPAAKALTSNHPRIHLDQHHLGPQPGSSVLDSGRGKGSTRMSSIVIEEYWVLVHLNLTRNLPPPTPREIADDLPAERDRAAGHRRETEYGGPMVVFPDPDSPTRFSVSPGGPDEPAEERDGHGLESTCARTAAAAVGRRSALEYLRDLGDGIDVAGHEVPGDGNRVDQRM